MGGYADFSAQICRSLAERVAFAKGTTVSFAALGATLDDGDRITLGTIGEDSPLPKVVAPEGCGRWEARRDAGTGLLEIVRRSGFVITIR